MFYLKVSSGRGEGVAPLHNRTIRIWDLFYFNCHEKVRFNILYYKFLIFLPVIIVGGGAVVQKGQNSGHNVLLIK